VGAKYGLQVKRVSGAAARAGMQPGDVIVGLGGEALSSFAQFKAAVSSAPKGSALALQLWRQGITLFVPLSIGGEE
jgi:serine protease Do